MIRWTPVLAHGGSLTIRCGLITPDIYPRSVTQNVPTLPQVQTDYQQKAEPRAAQNVFVMMSMDLAEFLEIENSGQ